MADRDDLARIDGVLDGDAADGAVIPVVLRFDVFGPLHLALDGQVAVLAELIFGLVRLAVFGPACLGPVPGHLGGVDPGKFGDVAALTGHLVRVVVGLGLGFVRRAAVAGFAGDLGGEVIFDQTLAVRRRRSGVDPAGNVVQGGGVAAGAVEVLAVDAHVNIQGFVGFGQRGVQIAVLDPVAPAALEVAGPAVLPFGTDHRLDGRLNVAADFIGDLLLVGILGTVECVQVLERLFPVDGFLTVAVEAVDGFGFGAPAGMAAQAALILHAVGRDAEVVDRIAAFAENATLLVSVGIPGPVDGLVKLIRRLRVTGEAGLGDFRTGPEILLKPLEPGMVGGDPQFLFFGGLVRHGNARRPLFCLFVRRAKCCGREKKREHKQEQCAWHDKMAP